MWNDEVKAKLCEIYRQRKEIFQLNNVDVDTIHDSVKREIKLLKDNGLAQHEITFNAIMAFLDTMLRYCWTTKNIIGAGKLIEAMKLLQEFRKVQKINEQIVYRLEC